MNVHHEPNIFFPSTSSSTSQPSFLSNPSSNSVNNLFHYQNNPTPPSASTIYNTYQSFETGQQQGTGLHQQQTTTPYNKYTISPQNSQGFQQQNVFSSQNLLNQETQPTNSYKNTSSGSTNSSSSSSQNSNMPNKVMSIQSILNPVSSPISAPTTLQFPTHLPQRNNNNNQLYISFPTQNQQPISPNYASQQPTHYESSLSANHLYSNNSMSNSSSNSNLNSYDNTLRLHSVSASQLPFQLNNGMNNSSNQLLSSTSLSTNKASPIFPSQATPLSASSSTSQFPAVFPSPLILPSKQATSFPVNSQEIQQQQQLEKNLLSLAQSQQQYIDYSPNTIQQQYNFLNAKQRPKRNNTERPVIQLSANLLQTYKKINEIYYARKKQKELAQQQQTQQQQQQRQQIQQQQQQQMYLNSLYPNSTTYSTTIQQQQQVPQSHFSSNSSQNKMIETSSSNNNLYLSSPMFQQQAQQHSLFPSSNFVTPVQYGNQSYFGHNTASNPMLQNSSGVKPIINPPFVSMPMQIPYQSLQEMPNNLGSVSSNTSMVSSTESSFVQPLPNYPPVVTAAATEPPTYNGGFDDADGNYIVRIGEKLNNRLEVLEILGKGSFGVVVRASDMYTQELLAVKIIKNRQPFLQQAKIEIAILKDLNDKDVNQAHHIVQVKQSFLWREHLCIVFELLSYNLYDLLKSTKFKGVSLNLIRKFGYQLLETLYFLSLPEVSVIHCDLKPENVLLKLSKNSSIKVIDFGSSCYLSKRMYKYIQSRFYRSPEVILGLPYNCAIDMWSLGCIMVEMHIGVPLFDGKDEVEQIGKIAQVIGMPPSTMIQKSPKKTKFFSYNQMLHQYALKQKNSALVMRNLQDIIGVYTGGPGGRRANQPGHSTQEYLKFLDLVSKMLTYDAAQRITPAQALNHEFFTSNPDLLEIDLNPNENL